MKLVIKPIIKPLHKVTTMAQLKDWLNAATEIKLYGAGYYANCFLQEIKKLKGDYRKKISCIMVADAFGNLPRIENIPVVSWREAGLKAGDLVFLTLGSRYTQEVYDMLKGSGADVFQMDFNLFQEGPYREVKKCIQPFLDGFSECVSHLNEPVTVKEITAWTCWWQGEEQAPELVKACMESQKRNLPASVRQVVITKDNYKDYISMPDYIIEKVNKGVITLTTFSDMIRAALLYRYGGFWLDATLFLLKPLDPKILDCPLYTRNLPETQYCTQAMWADWFLYARPGSILFQFLMEAFFYYYSVYDELRYYFLVDYFIAIACNTFSEVEKQLRQIPYNNEKAMECCKHLTDPFDEQVFRKDTEGTGIQKLTWKLNWTGISQENTLYQEICRSRTDSGRKCKGNEVLPRL